MQKEFLLEDGRRGIIYNLEEKNKTPVLAIQGIPTIRRTLKLIGDGGEGFVYKIIPESQSEKILAVKIYRDRDSQGNPLDTSELKPKLEYMRSHPPAKLLQENCIAWPLNILYDNQKRLIGFVMPYLDVTCTLREFFAYKHPIDKDYDSYPYVQSRILVALALAQRVWEIHKAGYVIGDMNHENIGILRRICQIQIIDCDSFTVTNEYGTTFRTRACLDDYIAPEITRHCKEQKTKGKPHNISDVALPTFTKETDLFCLAVNIFKLLMNGYPPFIAPNMNMKASIAIEGGYYAFKKSQTNLPTAQLRENEIPPGIKSLFDKAFLDGDKDPQKRPTPEEWIIALHCYIDKQLTQCSIGNHQYYSGLSYCPYCEADRRFYDSQPNVQNEKLHKQSRPLPIKLPPIQITSSNTKYRPSSSSQQHNTVSPSAISQNLPHWLKNKDRKEMLYNALVVVVLLITVVGILISQKRASNQIVEKQSMQDSYISNSENYSSISIIDGDAECIIKNNKVTLIIHKMKLNEKSGPLCISINLINANSKFYNYRDMSVFCSEGAEGGHVFYEITKFFYISDIPRCDNLPSGYYYISFDVCEFHTEDSNWYPITHLDVKDKYYWNNESDSFVYQ
ncbi:MAG: hypothetical protein K6B43_03820 [Treponema sp.]|nr:hypothetical protein [Treponema sp.]